MDSRGFHMKGSRKTLLAIVFLACGCVAHAQETNVSWGAFTSGFGELTDGQLQVEAVAGQPFAGEFLGPDLSVGGGFLYNPDISGQPFSVGVSLQAGWNLVSLPVTRSAANDSVRQTFPTATFEHGFAYLPGVGYAQEFRLANGPGYWIKFPSAGITSIAGEARPLDTLYVEAGWNLVGSISAIIDTATIVADPPGNRISPWFGYFGGLIPVDAITPGYAYWVKAEGPGFFVLGGTTGRRGTVPAATQDVKQERKKPGAPIPAPPVPQR